MKLAPGQRESRGKAAPAGFRPGIPGESLGRVAACQDAVFTLVRGVPQGKIPVHKLSWGEVYSQILQRHYGGNAFTAGGEFRQLAEKRHIEHGHGIRSSLPVIFRRMEQGRPAEKK